MSRLGIFFNFEKKMVSLCRRRYHLWKIIGLHKLPGGVYLLEREILESACPTIFGSIRDFNDSMRQQEVHAVAISCKAGSTMSETDRTSCQNLLGAIWSEM
jgi:hypothetical protein